MKNIKLKLIFISIFIILYSIIIYFNYENKHSLIQRELNSKIKDINVNFNITILNNKNDANSINFNLQNNHKLIDILSQAKDANSTTRTVLRKELYTLLVRQYKSMRLRGILEFQFVFPDNISFLRMHKPNKFGDDLTNIRYSFNNTNKTHKPSFGFEESITSHAFRNVYPIFNKDGEYIGCYETSFSSESIQNNLLYINKIHSHFLINKTINEFEKTNKKEYYLGKYIPSIENKDYLFFVLDNTNFTKLEYSKKYLIDDYRDKIYNKMKKSQKFAVCKKNNSKIIVIAFLPIKNIKGDKTVAYIVSYTKSNHIMGIKSTHNRIKYIMLIVLAIIMYLLYIQLIQKNILIQTTKEQEEVLSLFNKGNITLFRWKNNDNWSVEYVSKNVRMLTGYSREEFFSNKISYINIINRDDLKMVSDEVLCAVNNQTKLFTHTPYRIKTKDNIVKWIYDTTKVIRDDKGEITHFLGYIIDITKVKTLEIELNRINKNLKKEVENHIMENLKKDKILQEQSKLVAMGEMVGAIAHQWRQPLNALNINIQNLDDDYIDGLINEEFISNFINKQTKTINFMSKTIDDFRNFFRVDKIKKRFSVKEAINNTISIQEATLKSYIILIEIIGLDFEITTLEGEFQQIILNIISNAKDAFIQNRITDSKIIIKLDKDKIIISDNAGGISEDIIDRIFEPYFTTKEQGKGTGMGLYMSQVIMQKNIGGLLSVRNIDNGAEFTIAFD